MKKAPTESTSSKAANKPTFTVPPRISDSATIETYIVVPPDGGWGWLVVFAAFFSNFIADGTMYTFGIFLQDISNDINQSTEKVALINSIMTGSYFLSGPFVAALTNRFGYKWVAVSGCLIASVAILVTSYATEFIHIVILYGITAGIGFGMTYVASTISVGYYFERWRALATAIAATGSSIGMIAFPIVFTTVTKNEDWRTKYRIIAGFTLVSALLNFVHRRLQPVRVVTFDEKLRQYTGPSMASMAHIRAASNVMPSMSRYHNVEYPTTAELFGRSTIALERVTSASSTFIKASGPSTSSFATTRPNARLKTISEDEEELKIRCQRCRRCCKKCFCCHRSAPTTRPLYRDDIFYTGSLARLPQYVPTTPGSVASTRGTPWEKSAIDYHLSVTRVASFTEIEESARCCVICSISLKRALATLLDMSLLKLPSFFLLSISGFFSVLGLYTPFLFLSERAIAIGTSEEIAYNLITALGIANCIGRIVSGALSSFPNVNAILVSCLSLTISGLATIVSSFSHAIQFQFACGCIFASTIACVAALRPIIVCEMVGLEKLTNGFGISVMFQGLACLLGVPAASFLITQTGNYDGAFYFSGSSILFSAVLLIPIPKIMKWEKSH